MSESDEPSTYGELQRLTDEAAARVAAEMARLTPQEKRALADKILRDYPELEKIWAVIGPPAWMPAINDVEPPCTVEADGHQQFELSDDDKLAIAIAIRVARRLLADSRVTQQQIRGLKDALCALERMPFSTPGTFCQFGLIYRANGEMRFVDFRISEESFEICRGGSATAPAAGNDTYSEPGWEIDLGGYASRKCDLVNLEAAVMEFLKLGAEITATNE